MAGFSPEKCTLRLRIFVAQKLTTRNSGLTLIKLFKNKFDIIIIGAGPAGLCAALRLLEMGYQVGMVEQSAFPRPQIGESLSPGIRHIFSYLGAGHLLENASYLHGLPSHVIWESKVPVFLSAAERGPGVVVDRGTLDSDLLQLAVQRGLHMFQPGKIVHLKKSESGWQLQIRIGDQILHASTRLLIDASGRKGVRADQRIAVAPPSVAVWAHVPQHIFPQETRVEALRDGWFWGSPVPGGLYRIMLFTDTATLKKQPPEMVLQKAMQDSVWFAPAVAYASIADVSSCIVANYVHHQPWEDHLVRVGEAAFTLDPLSSTGVEKAMRFALQTAIVVNTLLKNQNAGGLARSFYEDKLAESVTSHVGWTREFYKRAWPGDDAPFWKTRAEVFHISSPSNAPSFINRLSSDTIRATKHLSPADVAPLNIDQVMKNMSAGTVRLSPETEFRETICVTGDALETRLALRHPAIDGDLAYLDSVEIKPMLDMITPGITVSNLIEKWKEKVDVVKARKFAAFLWSKGVLVAVR